MKKGRKGLWFDATAAQGAKKIPWRSAPSYDRDSYREGMGMGVVRVIVIQT